MKENLNNIQLIKNDTQSRFELHVDGYLSFINFGEKSDQIALVHTEVDPNLAGKGVGTALVEKTLNWIEENDKLLLPFCPFVFSYIKKHPEWKRIVSKNFVAYNKL